MVVNRALPLASRFTPAAAPIGFSGAFWSAGARVSSAQATSDGEGCRPSNTSSIGDSATTFLRSALIHFPSFAVCPKQSIIEMQEFDCQKILLKLIPLVPQK